MLSTELAFHGRTNSPENTMEWRTDIPSDWPDDNRDTDALEIITEVIAEVVYPATGLTADEFKRPTGHPSRDADVATERWSTVNVIGFHESPGGLSDLLAAALNERIRPYHACRHQLAEGPSQTPAPMAHGSSDAITAPQKARVR